jgi:hypothetical protein
MSGPTHSPRSNETDTATETSVQESVGTGSGVAGVGAQGQAQRMQEGMGNAAAQDMVDGPTWRESGNLVGSPPVRSEAPPNIGIQEFETVYKQRESSAQQLLVRQRANADQMLGTATSPLDNRYWFTKVYSEVTDNMLQSSQNRTFYYPSYVIQCVRYFDQIYENNIQAADAGLDVEDHWARAFDVCADEDGYFGPDILDFLTGDLYRSVSSLVTSMQAHIRYDLPRAEAWVFNSYYSGMAGANVKDFESDFMSMMDVFERASAAMNPVLSDLHHIPAELVPRSMQDLAMARWFDADMSTERAVTWERAEQLKAQDLVGTDPYREGPGNTLVGDVTSQDNLSNIQSLSGTAETPGMDRGFLDAAGETVGLDGESGWNPSRWFDDHNVRETVASSAAGGLAALPASERAQMMRRCAAGFTFNGDENTILTLIDASAEAGDLVATVDAANAYDLLFAIDGDEYDTLRSRFQTLYYPHTVNDVAMAYIRRAMNGTTNEWHEEMIVDILEAKRFMNADGALVEDLALEASQAHALITLIGEEFEGGGYDGGLIQLEEELDFGDEDRLHNTFGHAPDMDGDERVREISLQAGLDQRTLSSRVSMVNRLLSGGTGDDDEAGIVRILRASKTAGDLVPLIDTVGAIRIAEDVHGSEWDTVKQIFKNDYYEQTSQAKAFFMLNTCIVGDTAEWEEEMIADILVLRNDGRGLIERLGEGDGFKSGLCRVEWQLDGSDQDRVAAVYGTSGRWW